MALDTIWIFYISAIDENKFSKLRFPLDSTGFPRKPDSFTSPASVLDLDQVHGDLTTVNGDRSHLLSWPFPGGMDPGLAVIDKLKRYFRMRQRIRVINSLTWLASVIGVFKNLRRAGVL